MKKITVTGSKSNVQKTVRNMMNIYHITEAQNVFDTNNIKYLNRSNNAYSSFLCFTMFLIYKL